MSTDDIDRFGHCVICHNNLITKRIIDGKSTEIFLPIHDHTKFMLDNGSTMEVCICKLCKESIDLSDSIVHENIMKSVQKGWELETKLLIENNTWDIHHGNKYLQDMSKLKISIHADNIENRLLEVKSQELASSFMENNK